jgi:hypothetical protein
MVVKLSGRACPPVRLSLSSIARVKDESVIDNIHWYLFAG